MPQNRLDENRRLIDKALAELLNAANPVLERITQGRYQRTKDPLAMPKYCMTNRRHLRPHLEGLDITYDAIK